MGEQPSEIVIGTVYLGCNGLLENSGCWAQLTHLILSVTGWRLSGVKPLLAVPRIWFLGFSKTDISCSTFAHCQYHNAAMPGCFGLSESQVVRKRWGVRGAGKNEGGLWSSEQGLTPQAAE